MCNLFARFLLNFCGSATVRNGKEEKRKSPDFCSPKVKILILGKVSVSPPQRPDIYFRVHQRNKSSGNFDF